MEAVEKGCTADRVTLQRAPSHKSPSMESFSPSWSLPWSVPSPPDTFEILLPCACARNNPLLWVSLVPIPSAAAAATISESYVSWWGIHSSGFVHNFFFLFQYTVDSLFSI
jgi:hypothetical protein